VNKTEENVIQRKKLRNTVHVLCAVRKTEYSILCDALRARSLPGHVLENLLDSEAEFTFS